MDSVLCDSIIYHALNANHANANISIIPWTWTGMCFMTCFPKTNQMMMLINIINTLYLTFGGIVSVDKVSFYFNEQTDGLTDRKVLGYVLFKIHDLL